MKSQIFKLLQVVLTLSLMFSFSIGCVPSEKAPGSSSSSSSDTTDDKEEEVSSSSDTTDDEDEDDEEEEVSSAPDFDGASSITALSSTRVKVQWSLSDSTDVSGYRIYQEAANGDLTAIDAVDSSATSYTIVGLTPCTKYSYIVRAYNAEGEDTNTEVVRVMPYAGITSLVPTSGTTATVNFPACTNALELKIKCKSGTGTTYSTLKTVTNTSSTSTSITGLTFGIDYTCKVVPVDGSSTEYDNTEVSSASTCYGRVVQYNGHSSSTTSSTSADSFGSLDGTFYLAGLSSNNTLATGKVSTGFSFTGRENYVEVADDNDLDVTTGLTISAWIKLDNKSGIASSFAPIVSKKSINDDTAFNSPAAWDAWDVDGVAPNTNWGYHIGYDGQYAYYISGTIGDYDFYRIDLTADVTAGGSYETYQLNHDRNPRQIHYDGQRYIYIIPDSASPGYSVIVRYDTQADFTASGSYESFDLQNITGITYEGFQSAIFDGRYLYLAPFLRTNQAGGDGQPHGKVVRYDSQATFTSTGSWEMYDMAGTNSLDCDGIQNSIFDGRYIYFVNGQKPDGDSWLYPTEVCRFDTQDPDGFSDSASWTAYDATFTNGLNTTSVKQGVFDGRYIYWPGLNKAGNEHGKLLRYDTQDSDGFLDSGSWTAYDVEIKAISLDAENFQSATFDGRYIYFQSHSSDAGCPGCYHAKVLRYDTTLSFTDSGSYEFYDAGSTDGENPYGAVWGQPYDGRYIWYFANDAGGTTYQNIYRYDTLSADSGAFYQLFASSYLQGNSIGQANPLAGPSFVLNTNNGIVATQSDTQLNSNTWYHISGTYDGTDMKLYVDGTEVDSSTLSGTILTGTSELLIGATTSGGSAGFDGVIDEVIIFNSALEASDISALYASPSTACQ